VLAAIDGATDVIGAQVPVVARGLIHVFIAVVVHAVADLGSEGVDEGQKWRTVDIVGGAIVVVIRVAGVSQTVAVRVQLVIADLGAVVDVVGEIVVVVIRVHAVRQGVTVGVAVALVGLAVTVIVETITDLR
jgi:hypothetical protein